MPSWDDVRTLLLVAREGSHAAAARAMGIAATTIGRRVAALEQDLGAKLVRGRRGALALTEAGKALVARAERAEVELVAAEREVRGADVHLDGSVRLSAPDGLTTYVLVPRLGALLAAHPGLRLSLASESRVVDLSRREADVAFRVVRPRESSLVARKLATMPYGIFASEQYLARAGKPRGVADLASHAWLGFDASLASTPEMRWLLRRVPAARFAVTMTGTTAIAASCAAGLGLALMPVAFQGAEPRLVRVLPRLDLPARDVWGVFHADLRANARVKAVLAWGAEALQG
ncbi:LysR substrate-binding domain-containing protein [Sorangium sp. So ce131]|uniref:LysR family transcriptional regulator n=1 Tax=Sorangium sp. So ce131 TaxID=3133282 RepID=UPI003F5F12F2